MYCYWKVRVWDKDGRASAWSKPAYWTMGLLDREQFKAKWIGYDASRKREPALADVKLDGSKWIWYPEGGAARSAPAATRYFRRRFVVPQESKILHAFSAVTADNGYRMYLNGRTVQDGGDFKTAVAIDVAEEH